METILCTAVFALLAITLGPMAWGFLRGLNGLVRAPDSAVVTNKEDRTSEEIAEHNLYWWTGTGYMASDD